MNEFKFLQNQISKKWVISSPKRAARPDVARGGEPVCPFCLGREKDEPEVFRIGGTAGQPDWQVRVVPNKFPFAPIHEVVIHSPDHHKNFSELPLSHVGLIFSAYRQRYQTHKMAGQVVIFNNHGEAGGESLPHPHTQIAVVPQNVTIEIPRLEEIGVDFDPPTHSRHSAELSRSPGSGQAGSEQGGKALETTHFSLICPKTSQWPDEVWVAPKSRGRMFDEITDDELADLSGIVQKIVSIMTQVYGHEFPFNFYIYPAGDWYLRFIPRSKSIGGFELSTGIFVNTKHPEETIGILRDGFKNSSLSSR